MESTKFNPYCWFCKDYGKGKDTIIHETENFFVVPSLGTIVEGYLMILPKEHIKNIGSIPEELFDEFEEVKSKVKQILAENYCTPLFFEHGPVSDSLSQKGGCCIDHAHLHAVPIKSDLKEDLSEKFDMKKVDSVRYLIEQNKKNVPYLYYENQEGEKYVIELFDPIPSQYLRKIISVRIDKEDEWNWRENPNLELFYKTVENLRTK